MRRKGNLCILEKFPAVRLNVGACTRNCRKMSEVKAMGRLFAMDGKVFGFLSRTADLVLLNLLWILFSLPVVTLGASTTAIYTVVLKMARNE